ncbi:MAG: hypothetical protein KKA31_01235 [Candidatus Margulisbacteria bacterium]|nr:hypothetical protein [Candidatus Margulisiibacteriota bacterium]
MDKRVLLFFCAIAAIALPALAQSYPEVDISGYKKWEYRDAKVTPSRNYFQGLTYLGGFSPTATGSPWQERLKLNIVTKLSDKLTITYDVTQTPEAPDSFSTRVNYDDKHELVFGEFMATFSGNEFASATKRLNGMMILSKDESYSLTLVPSAKLNSYVQGITEQKGTNGKGPYSLGHGSIIEGSERIELNNVQLTRGTDYVIDYIEGKITFTTILQSTDTFSYSYAYTNITDLFFPALSRKDFFGFQGTVNLDPSTWGKSLPRPKRTIKTILQSFPTASAKDDVRSLEDSGNYQLDNHPIIKTSELVEYKGATLIRSKDYTIDPETGQITLLLNTLPTAQDPISVTYRFVETKPTTEYLPGEGSRGPYILSNKNLLPNSEEITIDKRLVRPEYDYLIDYEEGRIIFNFEVSNTSSIKVNYRYTVWEKAALIAPPEHPQELTLGAIYLKESARTGSGVAADTYTEPDPISGSDIIANNNTIYLSRYPLVPSREGGILILTLDGRTLVEGIDYVIPTVEVDPITGYAKVIPDTKLAFLNDKMDLTDGWQTGTIKMLTPVSPSSKIIATYSYKKSIVGRFAGTGNGGRGPYYISSYRDIVPGTEQIDVWKIGSSDFTTYTRNSSFEPDAGDTGYSINYYKENPYITFNKELDPGQNFSVYFQYVPPVAPTGNNLTQSLVGFNADYKFGRLLEFSGDLAYSEVDQVVLSVKTIEAAVFIPPTNQVSVTKHNTPAIVENTEKVYVNGYLRNKDIDYTIDYNSGIILFYYITLATADAVTVEYEYPDPGGIAKFGTKSDSAFRYGIKTNLEPLSVSYNEKAIGFDFSPLGGTPIGVGSRYKNFALSYAPGYHGLSTAVSYRENQDPQSGSQNHFNRRYERDYSLSLNPFNLAQMGASYKNVETKGDGLTPTSSLSANAKQDDYAANITLPGFRFGPLSYSQTYDGKLSDSQDLVQQSFSRSKYFHLKHGLGLTNRITAGLDYQFSEPYTLTNYQSSQETRSSWSVTRDTNYDLNIDLTFPLIRKWTAYVKLINHEEVIYIPASAKGKQTLNTTYHTELVPISILALSLDHNRQETPSVLVQGKNPKSEKTATRVGLTPLPYLSTSWDHSEDATTHDTGRQSSGRADSYTVGWQIYSTDNYSFNSNFNKYNRSDQAPSGTWESVKTESESFTQNYGMTYKPLETLIISPSFSQQDYQYRSEIDPALNASSQTSRLALAYDPFSTTQIAFDYSDKGTSTQTVAPRHKINWNLDIKHQVLNWGELVLKQNEEHNRGEVQANGKIPDIDYTTVGRSLALNFTVPQENPIISAILFSLSYKTVDFDNRLSGRAEDNFFASMMTFEGTLKF